MRTTLAIDDDVMAAARSLAQRQRMSVGEVISPLARQALGREVARAGSRNGVPLLPTGPDARPVMLELVNQFRDEGP
jgi:hypothetical protein